MKDKLAKYLMAHGVLKNADADKMASEILGMIGCDRLKASLSRLIKESDVWGVEFGRTGLAQAFLEARKTLKDLE